MGLKRDLLRITKAAAWALTGFVALALILALAVLIRPELVLNSSTLEWAAGYARRQGLVDAKWKDSDLDVEWESFLKRRIALSFRDLCVERSAGPGSLSIDGCFSEVRLGARLDLTGLRLRITEISPLVLHGEPLRVSLPETAEGEEEKKGGGAIPLPPENIAELLPGPLRKARFEDIDVRIRRAEIRSHGTRTAVDLELASRENGRGGIWSLKVAETTESEPAGSAHEARLVAELRTPARTLQGPWRADLDGSMRLGDGTRAGLSGRIRQEKGGGVWYSLKGQYTRPASRVRPRGEADAELSGEIRETGAKAVVSARARGLVPGLEELALRECHLGLQAVAPEPSGPDRARGEATVRCPVTLDFPEHEIRSVPEFKLPTRATVTVNADLKTSWPVSLEREVGGGVDLNLDPISTQLLQARGSVSAEIAGVPDRFPKGWKIETDVDLRTRVPKFQSLAQTLKGTPYAVPAPLNVLKGDVEMGTRGRMDLTRGMLPIFLRTRLDSLDQSLDVDASGEFRFERSQEELSSSLDLDVQLTDVKLVLPRFELKAPPQLVPDARIAKFGKKEATASGGRFKYNVRIRTPGDRPLRLVSNLADTPVPIHLDLKMSSGQEMKGSVRVANFPLRFKGTGIKGEKLLDRDAVVEQFRLDIEPGTQPDPVKGSIRVKHTDYTIRILVLGTKEEPRLQFVSDPPLPEDQVIATLFFGEPIEALDSEQVQAVGSLESAVRGRAVGLLPLYFLASTPIESVFFDPETGDFSASVRLAAGTSLRLGGKGEQGVEELQLRKRLGSYWSITTGLANLSQSGGQMFTAFLEWARRY